MKLKLQALNYRIREENIEYKSPPWTLRSALQAGELDLKGLRFEKPLTPLYEWWYWEIPSSWWLGWMGWTVKCIYNNAKCQWLFGCSKEFKDNIEHQARIMAITPSNCLSTYTYYCFFLYTKRCYTTKKSFVFVMIN